MGKTSANQKLYLYKRIMCTFFIFLNGKRIMCTYINWINEYDHQKGCFKQERVFHI